MPARRFLSSPWFPTAVSGTLTLALGALCLVQWVREAEITGKWNAAERRAHRAETAVLELDDRIENLTETTLRQTARIEELNRTLAATRDERDDLRHAAAERDAMAAALDELREALDLANERIREVNGRIAEQNENVRAQNEMIERLANERDRLVQTINERTAAYNELVERLEQGRR